MYLHNPLTKSAPLAAADTDLVLVTGSASGEAGNGLSHVLKLRENLAFFISYADNLVPGDTNNMEDIFVKDITTGAITRLSLTSDGSEANDFSNLLDVTADGKGILFDSNSTNLLPGSPQPHPSNYSLPLFYKNLTTGIVQQVDTTSFGVQGNGYVSSAQFMHDQTKVLFRSHDGILVGNPASKTYQIYIKDLASGILTTVSANSWGVVGNGDSSNAQMSADDHLVYMNSNATNLIDGDGNNTRDIFVKDLTTGAMTRLSTTSSGAEINGSNYLISVTDDGDTMLFASLGTNLATSDTNNSYDIFSKNLTTGVVTTVSSSSTGELGNAEADVAWVSPDAQQIMFYSTASNLVAGDTNGSTDLFLKDMATGTMTRIFTGDAAREGDSSYYTVLHADHDNKLVVQIDTSNTLDNDAAQLNGGRSVSFIYIYVIDLATLQATLLASGAIGADYLAHYSVQDQYSDLVYLNNVTSDSEHLLLEVSQNTATAVSYPLVANSYLAPLTTTSLPKNVGDSHGNILTGHTGVNYMYGLGGNDTLTSNTGNDFIDGGVGADTMIGGAGNDTYYVDNAGDVVTELHGGGVDTVITARAYTLGSEVDKLTLTGTSSVVGTGNALNNVLIGNDGNNKLLGLDGNDSLAGGLGKDTLDGGKGADTMKGGLGDDSYYLDNKLDVVTEYSGQGNDTAMVHFTYTLGLNVENLTLTGAGSYFGTGNALDNILNGNNGDNTLGGGDGNDVINGGRGADSMRGGNGNDVFYVDNAGDTVTEYSNQGIDIVFSSVSFTLGNNIEDLTLSGAANLNATGNTRDNSLTGNGGNNILDGGHGLDTLTGGLGADTFLFGLQSGADTVTDFSASQGDKIDVSAHHAHATAVITQVGSDTLIDLGGGNVVTVSGVTATDAAFLSHIVW